MKLAIHSLLHDELVTLLKKQGCNCTVDITETEIYTRYEIVAKIGEMLVHIIRMYKNSRCTYCIIDVQNIYHLEVYKWSSNTDTEILEKVEYVINQYKMRHYES